MDSLIMAQKVYKRGLEEGLWVTMANPPGGRIPINRGPKRALKLRKNFLFLTLPITKF